MRRTIVTLVLFFGAAFAPDASAGPLDPFVSIGCWSDQNNCGDGRNSALLHSPLQIAVSPDGKNVYSRIGGGGIAWSTRDGATGALTPTGCIADSSSAFLGASSCTTGAVVGEATDIVVSPDGANVYQATDGRLEVFTRDAATGALAYKECFGTSGDGACANVAGINIAFGLAVSPDGANVYVASRGGAGYLQVFSRDGTGHLSDGGCFSTTTCGANPAAPGVGTARRVAVTPDGGGVYVVGAPANDGTIAWFNRSATTGHTLTYGGCQGPAPCPGDVTSYSEPLGIAISPDGHSVYVATAATYEAQLHHFERASDNSLVSHECWTDPTRTSACGDGRQVPEIGAGQSIAMTNTQLFVAAHEQSAVTAFARDTTTGGLTPQGCVKWISTLHGCGETNEYSGLEDIRSVRLSPDATTLYVGAVYGISAFQAPGGGGTSGGGGGGGSGGGGGGGGAGSTPIAPVIGTAALSSKVLHNGKSLKLTVSLDRAAAIRVRVARLVAGRRSKGRCVAPTKRLRRAKRCTRALTARTLTASGATATLVIKAKGLKLGRYRVTVTATADGLTSTARTLSFTRKR